MNKGIYAIYDRVAGEIIGRAMYALMIFRTGAEATRYFADAVNDQTSVINKHPSDYELRLIGVITENGNIVPEDQHRTIITGDSLVAAQAAPDEDETKVRSIINAGRK